MNKIFLFAIFLISCSRSPHVVVIEKGSEFSDTNYLHDGDTLVLSRTCDVNRKAAGHNKGDHWVQEISYAPDSMLIILIAQQVLEMNNSKNK